MLFVKDDTLKYYCSYVYSFLLHSSGLQNSYAFIVCQWFRKYSFLEWVQVGCPSSEIPDSHSRSLATDVWPENWYRPHWIIWGFVMQNLRVSADLRSQSCSDFSKTTNSLICTIILKSTDLAYHNRRNVSKEKKTQFPEYSHLPRTGLNL